MNSRRTQTHRKLIAMRTGRLAAMRLAKEEVRFSFWPPFVAGRSISASSTMLKDLVSWKLSGIPKRLGNPNIVLSIISMARSASDPEVSIEPLLQLVHFDFSTFSTRVASDSTC